MYCYIDVGLIVQALPLQSSTNTYPNIEFDVCLLNESIIQSGVTQKVKTTVAVYNIPDTHYIEFKGIKTNIGIFTKEGVLRNDSFGYLYVYVHNTSLEIRKLPSQMQLGTLLIKPFLDYTAIDWVDEIFMHGGHSHRCTFSCSQYETED